jgi:uncharacterized protein YeaO (DUF488 family)
MGSAEFCITADEGDCEGAVAVRIGMVAGCFMDYNWAGIKVMIQVKRVYDTPAKSDGRRFLVDRLWPRGVKKEALQLEGWLKEAAPSNELRRWFKHDPVKWKEFQKRYRVELAKNPQVWEPLLEATGNGALTLLFSAHDAEHNNAVVLRDFLLERLKFGTK